MEDRPIVLPIENCKRWFRFLCPREWNQLQVTSDFDIRYCLGCNKNVYDCDTLEDVEEHRKAGHCICVESHVEGEGMYLGEPS